ncbi:unnamed protein product [Allacma fusca]|uniref:Uncharacterized protein n=1 Tax=Allacma fusca TaxID=39272 RepID=A0A8J2L9U1_9HEXA|nr:unnamed protein product [Allacma fusca]
MIISCDLHTAGQETQFYCAARSIDPGGQSIKIQPPCSNVVVHFDVKISWNCRGLAHTTLSQRGTLQTIATLKIP